MNKEILQKRINFLEKLADLMEEFEVTFCIDIELGYDSIENMDFNYDLGKYCNSSHLKTFSGCNNSEYNIEDVLMEITNLRRELHTITKGELG